MDHKNSMWVRIWIALSILCVVYGRVVREAGSGTGFFLVWIAGAIFFLLLAGMARRGTWGQLPILPRRLILLIASIGIGFFLVTEAFILSGFRQRGREDLEAIVVLGAQVYENGPSAVLQYRLDAAIEYLEENPDTVCIVSGGQGYNEPCPEAEIMAKYLEEHGIDAGRIRKESASLTTKENLINSRELMSENASVGIVTNNFHVFRAVRTAKKLGYSDVCGIAADTNPLYLPNNMVRECLALIKSELLG